MSSENEVTVGAVLKPWVEECAKKWGFMVESAKYLDTYTPPQPYTWIIKIMSPKTRNVCASVFIGPDLVIHGNSVMDILSLSDPDLEEKMHDLVMKATLRDQKTYSTALVEV